MGFATRAKPTNASKRERAIGTENFSQPKAKEPAVPKAGYVLRTRAATETGIWRSA